MEVFKKGIGFFSDYIGNFSQSYKIYLGYLEGHIKLEIIDESEI